MDDNQDENIDWWRFFDGSTSVSVSMLVAVLLSKCVLCENWPVIGLLKSLTGEEDGIIIVATMLLFPTTLMMYGGAKLIFAAKRAVERETRERLKKQREEGIAEGRAEGRKEVRAELEKRGMLTPELAEVFEEKEDE